MVTSLRGRLSDLATEFVSTVLNVVRHASVEEILGGGAPAKLPARTAAAHRPASSTLPPAAPRRRSARPTRLARRSAGDIAGVIERIVELVQAHPEGLRAEQIREELELEAKELPRPLNDAIAAGRLRKSGQKRATTYFVKAAAVPRTRAGAAKKAVPSKRSPAPRVKRVRRSAAVEPSVGPEAASDANASTGEKPEKIVAPPSGGAAQG